MQQLFNFLNNIEDLIVIFDEDRNVVFSNDKFNSNYNSNDLENLTNDVYKDSIKFINNNYLFKKSYSYINNKKYLIVNGSNNQNFDSLTNLPNMKFFYQFCKELLTKYTDESLAIIYFDIDKFKTINDLYGFEGGNNLLKFTAKTINENLDNYILARFSDDHFVALSSSDNLETNLKTIHKLISNYDTSIKIEVKCGINIVSNNQDIVKACDQAKLACDTLKSNYELFYKFFDDELREQLLKEKYLCDHLDDAIANNNLIVYYQPVIRVLSKKVCGLESLIRWDDKKYGFMTPNHFINIIEKNHLIHKLDLYVLKQALKDLKRMENEVKYKCPISINLSRLDFILCDIYKEVNDIVEEAQVDKKWIHLEVTESALVNDSKILLETVEKFRNDGYELWLDDFGSDYSTLNTLQNYDFDVLKIDMQFFASFNTNIKSKTIISSVVNMAKELQLRTVAEGIENEDEFKFLKAIGCDKAQGYYFYRPLPLDVLYHLVPIVETYEEKKYYDNLGKINVLNNTKLFNDNDFLINPLAIIQFQDNAFTVLYNNSEFLQSINSLNIKDINEYTEIMNEEFKFNNKINDLINKAILSDKTEHFDTIYEGQNVNLKIKIITKTDDTIAFYLSIINFSQSYSINKGQDLDSYLNFLYSIYNRVDIIDAKNSDIQNVYLNSLYYESNFSVQHYKEDLKEFAQLNIYPDDQDKFIEFYTRDKFIKKIEDAEKDYISTILRTKTKNNEYIWQVYIIIKVNQSGNSKYLSCVRDFNLEKISNILKQ